MKPDIAAKLAAELQSVIRSERQVVYILVETRKLLELTNAKDRFLTLRFCCDWAVHSSLEGRFSQEVIAYFDEYEEIFQQNGLMPQDYDFSHLFSITKHVSFREQLISFLNANDIDCGSLQNDSGWADFIELYTQVIQDCPLEAKTNSRTIKHVSKVLVSALPPESSYRKLVGGPVLRWVWEDKSGNILRKIDSYF